MISTQRYCYGQHIEGMNEVYRTNINLMEKSEKKNLHIAYMSAKGGGGGAVDPQSANVGQKGAVFSSS